jgi:hypothetical protein
LSTIVGAGTALVGNFGLGAHIWRKGGVTVDATNSHSEAGWLERRTVDANGDTAWFWTAEAEMALDMSALNQSVEDRQN